MAEISYQQEVRYELLKKQGMPPLPNIPALLGAQQLNQSALLGMAGLGPLSPYAQKHVHVDAAEPRPAASAIAGLLYSPQTEVERVASVDRLMQLKPGAHNYQAYLVSHEVEMWAQQYLAHFSDKKQSSSDAFKEADLIYGTKYPYPKLGNVEEVPGPVVGSPPKDSSLDETARQRFQRTLLRKRRRVRPMPAHEA